MYSKCIFLDCYNVYSILQAYFLHAHGNGVVSVLGKLPYFLLCIWNIDLAMRHRKPYRRRYAKLASDIQMAGYSQGIRKWSYLIFHVLSLYLFI